MIRLLPLLVTLVVALPPQADNPPLPLPEHLEISGYYLYQNEDGATIGLTAVSKTKAGSYLFQYWAVDRPEVIGVGVRDDVSVSVAWKAADGGIGVSKYRVIRDGAGKPKMDGSWTTLGATGRETLTWLRPLDK